VGICSISGELVNAPTLIYFTCIVAYYTVLDTDKNDEYLIVSKYYVTLLISLCGT